MRTIGFDTETCLIRPGVTAPEMACLTWAERVGGKMTSGIYRWDAAEPVLRSWLLDDNVTLSGAHVSFDACVVMANYPKLVDLVFAKYRKNLVECVQYRDRALDIAAGKFQGYHTPSGGWVKPTYDLDALSRRYRGISLNKPIFDERTGLQLNDSFRLRYGELLYVPIELWPAEALRYAIEDAVATLEVREKQEVHVEFLGEQHNQVRKALALQLNSCWGLKTNPTMVRKLAEKATAERELIRQRLEDEGLVRSNGVRDTKAARAYMVQVCRENGIAVPLTETGCDKNKTRGLSDVEIALKYASLAEDACDATNDIVLGDYADFGRLGSTLSKDVTALARGTLYPIHTRYGMAATTRTTSSKPNIQNWGTGWGPRECFEARPGKVYLQADYPQLELKTLAQSCLILLGHSRLADVLNSGKDPHSTVAAVILGITYDEVIRRKHEDIVYKARQTAKVANFGFPGGLGAKNLVKFAKKNYKVILSIEDAKLLKAQWLKAFPEMEEYFAYMGELTNNPSGLGEIMIPGSKQIRGGAMFCALCNTPFQGLGAVCSGEALWLIAEACYVDRKSILFGCRNVCHVHDENILECTDDGRIHEAAWELARIMDVGANKYLPDVPMKTDPVVMRFWSKEAFALKGADKKLIPWAGHWQCEDCDAIFLTPMPGKKERKCGFHVGATPWSPTDLLAA